MPTISLKSPDAFAQLLEFAGGDIDIEDRGQKGFKLVGDDHTLIVKGHGFHYDHGAPSSGTVDRIELESDSGTDVLIISKIGLTAQQLIHAVQTQDFDALTSGPITLKGSAGGDAFTSGKGADHLFGLNGDDSISGGGGNDEVSGGKGDDALQGGSGNDDVGGAAGNDFLGGGVGNDKLSGAQGDDTLQGGDGKDKLDGGSGADTFLFNSAREANNDTIVDFNRKDGGDVIDLHGFDADANTAGLQHFDFVGKAGFSGSAGELRVSGDKIMGDIDGDGTADFTIHSKGASHLDADNFLLG